MSITKNDFAAKVRRKIAGWYDNEEYEKIVIRQNCLNTWTKVAFTIVHLQLTATTIPQVA